MLASPFDSPIDIGQFVRQRRKAALFTQQELADLVGVGRRVVSELESGKPTLRVDSVNKVVAVFGKTLGLVDLTREDQP